MTTRWRVLWILTSREDGLGALAAHTLGLGVLGFDLGVPTPIGLPLGGLPAADLALALGILAVTLVPAPLSGDSNTDPLESEPTYTPIIH